MAWWEDKDPDDYRRELEDRGTDPDVVDAAVEHLAEAQRGQR